eukprot:591121-Amorphochlora_amoeboformis.AAC.1
MTSGWNVRNRFPSAVDGGFPGDPSIGRLTISNMKLYPLVRECLALHDVPLLCRKVRLDVLIEELSFVGSR